MESARSTRRSALKLGLTVAVAAALGSGGPSAFAQGSAPIKVGLLLSAAGPGAAAGVGARIGARMAAAEINASGGVLGRQLQLIDADDQSDATAGQNEAIRLTTREKIDYMVGPQLSQLAIAVAPTLNAAGIMWGTTTSASDSLTTKFAPRHFSLLYTSKTQALVLAQHAAKFKAKTIAMATDNGASSLATVEALKKEFPAHGVTITGAEQWTFGAADITPQLLSLRRGNPEMLFLSAATGRDLGYALKNLGEIGWKVPILGGGAFGTLAAQAAAISGPEPLRNVLAFTYTGMTACPKDPLGTTLYAQLLAKLKKQEPANYDKISHFNVASGYDIVYMLKYAATGANSIDGSKMTAWMEENAHTLKLVYSPIRASKDDHFLLGPEAETMGIDVMTPRADGTLKRAGC